MRLALSGLLFDQAPAADFAAAAREIGYAGVELRGTRHQLPPDADATRLDLLRELFEGLEIVNIASHAGNFALLDEVEALEPRDRPRTAFLDVGRGPGGSQRADLARLGGSA